jgi:hypothetical protein
MTYANHHSSDSHSEQNLISDYMPGKDILLVRAVRELGQITP